MSTVCLDFDGVLHSYKSGWQGANVIPDDPVPGAIEFVNTLLENGFSVKVYSARSHQKQGRMAMAIWLAKHGFPYQKMGLPNHKPASVLYIDDRGFRFNGIWPTIKWIKNFKPWNKT